MEFKNTGCWSVALFLCVWWSVGVGKASGLARIAAGQIAAPHSLPWQVSLQYQDGYHICGGVLLEKLWVLTAAHCIEGLRPEDLRVVLGEHRLSQREGPEQFINVSTVNIHPFFNLVRPNNAFYLPHDLAMLRLSASVKVNTFVQPADLASPQVDYTGQMCTFAGWGGTGESTDGSDVLLKSEFRILDNFECRLTWTTYIYYGNVCASNEEATPCEGDSGGPIICWDDETPYVVGVSSWGHPDCEPYPSVFTRISENLGWIREVIEESF